MSVDVHRLGPNDLVLMNGLNDLFGVVFNDLLTYTQNRPSLAYLQRLLADDSFIGLVALKNGEIVGGLTAYELKKYEQERSEIYIYDLGVASSHRRQGIATALITQLKQIAADRGAYVIFVQADTTDADQPAIALYTKLGIREDVLHFDIPVEHKHEVGCLEKL
ncbi:AAC(3)-I family aminoglycoside N-acetyltransferase [Synechococcus sp. PCC 6312]|uniref:AAC(3)-I family aminoglycoside N-acetyltransferase n=1 Tax=Synechococcus sp. (strain ATCC 27167 / PCC 6312) TaxID=195253 RepID=UPI00029EC73C|nr:AAC(3)-I family aminoglycoside N-acetyltransferase [Synechococcus sp. PCC 6312]AFY60168.1 acetyltransferase [Synechococcus sp. PCC 6312]